MTKNIFFDLDGTLLDCSQRLYNLFQQLVPQSKLSFTQYWQIKRERVDQKKLLSQWFNYSDEEIAYFKEIWLQKVEDEERLAIDKPFNKAVELLEKLEKNYNLYIVTNRQSVGKTISQIKNNKLDKYFKKILVTEQKMTKTELIKQNISYSTQDIFIGDTGEDILTGKELGFSTIAVYSGFLGKEVLQEYKPDIIFANIEEIYESNSL